MRMFRRFGFGFPLISILVSTLSWGKDLTVAVSVDIMPRDPVDLKLLDEWEIFAGVYDTLVQYDSSEGFTGILAEKWEFSAKEKTLTFKMRSQAKFSDGTPITADDAAFSFRRVLYLDQDGSQILSRCLSGPMIKLSSPEQPHPGIRTPDSTTLVIGPLQCGETLLNELANANYGIISRKSLDVRFKVKSSGPFSGLFTYRYENGEFILSQNLQNWRWGNPQKKTSGNIHVVRFSPERFLNGPSSVQLLRISDPGIYRRAKSLGYRMRLSLPIMTWYLAPATMGRAQIWERDVINDINANLDRKKLGYFVDNPLEHVTTNFFPEEFNCGPSALGGQSEVKNALDRKAVNIEFVEHSSGESKVFSHQVADELRLLGYSVGSATAGKKKYLKLTFRRQFLGDSVVNVLLMIFWTLKTIPDPNAEIIPQLQKIERMDKVEQRQFLKTVCGKFHHFNHIPIAYRNYALAASDDDLLGVFSKVTGNLLLEELTKYRDRL